MHIISDLGFSAAIEEMYTESARLSSFKNWPFNDDSNCSAAKMAEAGFYHCPTAEEPDVVQCYVCFKELDGWEPNDDPWDEHFSHSKNCMFAKLHKAQKDLTISEIYAIEAERKANKVKKITALKCQKFRCQIQDSENFLLVLKEEIGGKKK
ncbi:baculoviral IAP repeat-containing protein 5-like [Uloborus diversus]|uniref:baculoviral IAP repeat-containing protein 5-like n=1 Tax=Uloborus diversus TaxID=327109 RepID=UPI00240A01EF|nr:baculoviral IAP repeat-containing protein 5-like [Uloborus diversus]